MQLQTLDLNLGKFFKIYFFPSEMRDFWLFQQARCDVNTNCNLSEYEWIRTGIGILEAQTDDRKRTLKFAVTYQDSILQQLTAMGAQKNKPKNVFCSEN